MLDREVLVVGDIVCDEWRFVARAAHNPENAFLCLRSEPGKEIISLGGAGLTALCLRQLGARVRLFGAVSLSDRGAKLMSLLRTAGINASSVSMSARDMSRKLRDVSDVGQILVRHDIEDPRPDAVPSLFDVDAYKQALLNASCVVVSDYCKGYLNGQRQVLVDLATAAGVPVFVDCKAAVLDRYDGVTGIKINLPTAATFASKTGSKKAIADYVHRRMQPAVTVVTCGAEGVTWCMDAHTRRLRFDLAHAGSNAVGAGDAFFAGFVTWLLMAPSLSGMTPALVRDALLFGHVTAVDKLRTVVPELSPSRALATYCRERSRGAIKHKIMPPSAFAAFARACHLAGDKVAFTNGCFDIFHAGHLRVLQQAKQLGEVVVVALDSDVNVTRLKGADRPVYDEQARANILAALQLVDAVTIFTDDETNTTLRDLIVACRPDFLVKGGDYHPHDCVGWEEMTQRPDPGEVVCCEYLPNVSTTNIINSLRGAHV